MPVDRRSRRPGTTRVGPGTVVAEKYVVDEVLGTGAMGFVVSATHKLIGQRVAIKLIKAEYVESEDALARFKREARALVAVESENVVRVLDYGTMPDESPYLVMEYLTGRDLQEELRERTRLPLAEAAEIVVQACEGLAAAHALGIVHRDVKPANLFLSRRGSGKLVVKIVDFGISKSPKATEDELQSTRGSIGSPHYMSPEQLRAASRVDARSDVWSLGVTLFRALTGDLPFAGDSIGTLLAAVVSGEPRRIRDARPELPEEIEEIVTKCLQKNVEDRFAGTQELADALAPFAMPSERTRVAAGPSPVPPAPTPYESTSRAHVAPIRRPPEAPDWRPRAALTAAIVVPLAVVSLVLRFAPSPGARSASAAASATTAVTAAAPPSITDIPLPKSADPAASAAYLAGLQAVRDGSFVEATNAFERAAQLDPTLAAAHLRAALYGDWLVGSDTHRHAREALALRASLSAADRALIGAVEPLYLPPRPEVDEALRRVDGLVAASPNDPELVLLSGMLFLYRRPHAEVRALAARALALDPRFAGAVWLRSVVDELAWDPPAIVRDTDQCLAISPSAASCLRVRAFYEDVTGNCAALESDAQRMVAMEETSYRAHEFLSIALYARGRPIDSVREALARKWHATPPASRDAVRLTDEAGLAVLRGDFAAASKIADELDRVTRDGAERQRAAAALFHIDLDEELGDSASAAKIADAYLRRLDASPGSEAIDDDPRPSLYAAAVRGGLRTAEERDRARDAWRTLWELQLLTFERSRIWIEGYAAPAHTKEEAETALAALPAFAPIEPMVVAGPTSWALAKVYALAGHTEEALPELRLTTASCHTLAEPFRAVRSQLFLGQALEATGDTKGACAAYGAVLEHWGVAKRSVSGATAAARARVLGCRG